MLWAPEKKVNYASRRICSDIFFKKQNSRSRISRTRTWNNILFMILGLVSDSGIEIMNFQNLLFILFLESGYFILCVQV